MGSGAEEDVGGLDTGTEVEMAAEEEEFEGESDEDERAELELEEEEVVLAEVGGSSVLVTEVEGSRALAVADSVADSVEDMSRRMAREKRKRGQGEEVLRKKIRSGREKLASKYFRHLVQKAYTKVHALSLRKMRP